jgi:hypothetical protein
LLSSSSSVSASTIVSLPWVLIKCVAFSNSTGHFAQVA